MPRAGPPGGNEDAETTRLYEAYSDQLVGFCTKRLGSRTEAEDAVQLTFLYAFRALQRGVVPEAESAWLHAIAANVCRWQQRTRSRRGPLSSDLDLDQIAAGEQAGGDQRSLCHDLKEALRTLPATQRRALVLREWHGVPSHEVAGILGMSTSATYALLTRARQSFVRAFEATREAVPGIQLAAFLPELRAQLKSLFASASAKTATVATVAAVGVGGVAVERSLDAEKTSPSIPAGTVAPSSAPGADGASASTIATGAGQSLAPGGRSTPRVSGPAGRGEPGTGVVVPPRSPRNPLPAPEQEPAPEPGAEPPSPTSPTTEPEPSPDPPASLPVDLPKPPSVDPPKDELPPIDPPPIDPPPIDPPPIDLPPIELGPTTVDVPPIDVPAVDLPPVDVPTVDLPDLPGPL